MAATPQPIAILIAALGGQGGGVLAEWLVEAAIAAGYPAQSTSIPGVAQRTGATTYYVEILPVPLAELGGRRPVLSLLPVPGCIDLLVASELLEAVRIVQSGMVAPERTLVVASTRRTLTTAEKMAPGDGRYDSDRLLAIARRHSRRLVTFDMEDLAQAAGTVVSSVLYGAVAASGVLPLARAAFEDVIRGSGLPVAASLAGFANAWEAMQEVGAGASGAVPGSRRPETVTVPVPAESAPVPVATAPVPAAVAQALPPAVHYFAGEGHRRLVAFQDEAYADLYVRRLRRIVAAEAAADPGHARNFEATREAARFLALWMAFDDVVRVAAHKCRASRFARVRREVGAGERDVVKIVDFLKPGIAELAGLLPGAPARWLTAWDRRRQARGKAPAALALHLRADSVTGLVALRLLASMRALRRRGSRYAHEQATIEHWLAALEAALAADWSSGLEVALCGRLVKGYGATNERGKASLRHILDHVVAGQAAAEPAGRAAAIRRARESALADEEGKRLDATLAELGAPPRPVPAQPIRWIGRRAASTPGRKA